MALCAEISHIEPLPLPKSKTMKQQTLMQDVCDVVRMADGSKLTTEFWDKSRPILDRLANRLELTPEQALLLSVMVELSDTSRIELSKIASFFDCRKVELLCYAEDLAVLNRKGFIRRRRGCSANTDAYRIPPMVLRALQQDQRFEPPSNEGLTIDCFFLRWGGCMADATQNELSEEELFDELQLLIERNQQLEFCRLFREATKEIAKWDVLIFAQCCNRYVNHWEDRVGWSDFEHMFSEESTSYLVKASLLSHTNMLFDLNILENTPNRMFGEREAFRLTNRIKKMLFVEVQTLLCTARHRKELIPATKILPKSLYFNPEEQEQIDRLAQLLDVQRFGEIRRRLQESDLRQGFACLFYGSPGTGKTESVYQLARRCGRDIMLVDITETKSMWFGESEKQIKDIFERYRNYVLENDRAPILLFNEADAVLGQRRTTTHRAVDQTENTMQNILLQEIEQLDGILIATTNLTQNFDKAFERRFLYKIEFHRPASEARRDIWQAMLPALPMVDAEELARRFELSGGQIENVVRKYTIDRVLEDESKSQDVAMADRLKRYCMEELRYRADARNKIGY